MKQPFQIQHVFGRANDKVLRKYRTENHLNRYPCLPSPLIWWIWIFHRSKQIETDRNSIPAPASWRIPSPLNGGENRILRREEKKTFYLIFKRFSVYTPPPFPLSMFDISTFLIFKKQIGTSVFWFVCFLWNLELNHPEQFCAKEFLRIYYFYCFDPWMSENFSRFLASTIL